MLGERQRQRYDAARRMFRFDDASSPSYIVARFRRSRADGRFDFLFEHVNGFGDQCAVQRVRGVA